MLICLKIQEINNDNHWEEDCFRSMLEHYLTHAEPHPQWSDIIKALLSPVVDCPHLISRVAELAENEIRETGERTGVLYVTIIYTFLVMHTIVYYCIGLKLSLFGFLLKHRQPSE